MLTDPVVKAMAASMAALQAKLAEAQSLVSQVSAEHSNLADAMEKAASVKPTLADVKAMWDQVA